MPVTPLVLYIQICFIPVLSVCEYILVGLYVVFHDKETAYVAVFCIFACLFEVFEINQRIFFNQLSCKTLINIDEIYFYKLYQNSWLPSVSDVCL